MRLKNSQGNNAKIWGLKNGALGRTRTSNRLVRSQVLYPVELRARIQVSNNMARSGGFEPPTAWFVARYSIQLSYERVIVTSNDWRRGRDSNPR